MDPETLEKARAVAYHFLGHAPRSRIEMERRLERAEFVPEVIAAVLDELTARGWMDDTRFARQWIEDRADRKRYGRSRLAAELRRKGVDKEIVDAALSQEDDAAERERALQAARPKWRTEWVTQGDAAALQTEKRRLANFLQRRGFSWDIITQVLKELTANQE